MQKVTRDIVTYKVLKSHGIEMGVRWTLLAKLVEHSFVHGEQQCVTLHQVPKCMSY